MKPRIAFCFSGQARTFDATYPYFKKNLFEAASNQGFEYDIFCAVEDDVDSEKIHLMNPSRIEKIKSIEVAGIIHKKYGGFIKKHINKDIILFQLLNYKFENCLQQFYKILRADLLRKHQEKEIGQSYDIIFRLRFDVIIFDTIDFTKLLEDIQTKNALLVNFSPVPTNTTIFDLILIGGSKNMSLYAHIFEDVESGFITPNLSFIQRAFLLVTYPMIYSRRYLDKHCKKGTSLYYFFNLLYSGYSQVLEKFGIPLYSFEKILQTYLNNKEILLHDSKINYILLRKLPEESICKFFEGKTYTL